MNAFSRRDKARAGATAATAATALRLKIWGQSHFRSRFQFFEGLGASTQIVDANDPAEQEQIEPYSFHQLSGAIDDAE